MTHPSTTQRKNKTKCTHSLKNNIKALAANHK